MSVLKVKSLPLQPHAPSTPVPSVDAVTDHVVSGVKQVQADTPRVPTLSDAMEFMTSMEVN